jgi:hypothetical protein
MIRETMNKEINEIKEIINRHYNTKFFVIEKNDKRMSMIKDIEETRKNQLGIKKEIDERNKKYCCCLCEPKTIPENNTLNK